MQMNFRNSRLIDLFAAALLTGSAISGTAVCCDTPVYRYAMYRWEPAAYLVLHVHTGTPDDSYTSVEDAVEKLRSNRKRAANIDLLTYDLKKNQQNTYLPPYIARTVQDIKPGSKPTYLVFSPKGAVIHRGALSGTQLAQMVMSPRREQLVKSLTEGSTCVFLVLEIGDQQSDDAAVATLNKVFKDVDTGKISLAIDVPGIAAQATEEEKKDKPKHQFTIQRIGRGEADEQWLQKMLLAIEPDLPELKETMVFPVFGRGRVLPPYVGKGINYENMVDCLYHITGPCSCTEKAGNPGCDLLTNADWEAAAEAMAERHGSEEGNEAHLTDLFPQLIIPGATVQPEKSGNDSAKPE